MTNTPGKRIARLRILATTDLHLNLMGFDYAKARAATSGGLLRIATLIARARQQAKNTERGCLLVDNGDLLQGNALDELPLRAGHPHPAMTAMRHLGYDALGLGNHDLNFGRTFLQRVVADAPCPVLCSNLAPVGEVARWPVRRSAILRVPAGQETLRVGVLSVLPPQTLLWDAHVLHGSLRAEAIAAAAMREAAALRAAGCDLVVALAHTGFEAQHRHQNHDGPQIPPSAGSENAVLQLARPGQIDALVLGHTHDRFPGPAGHGQPGVTPETGQVGGVPAVMAGAHGRFLGQIDLDLVRPATGAPWKIHTSRSALVEATADVPPDPALRDLLWPAHRAALTTQQRVIGRTKVPLHSYTALLAPDAISALLARTQINALRPHLTGDLPLLAAVAAVRFGGRSGPEAYADIPPGDLRHRHLADLSPFPNDLAAVEISGALLRDWLEMAASVFHRINPHLSHPQALIRSHWPSHLFDTIHGLRYLIDLSRPAKFDLSGKPRSAGGRIRHLTHAGRPVADTARFVVATTSYRANGGGYPMLAARARPLPLPPLPLRGALAAQISRAPVDLRPLAAHWALRAPKGSIASARTGPGAWRYLGDAPLASARECGIDAEGFLNLQLAF